MEYISHCKQDRRKEKKADKFRQEKVFKAWSRETRHLARQEQPNNFKDQITELHKEIEQLSKTLGEQRAKNKILGTKNTNLQSSREVATTCVALLQALEAG